MATDEQGTHFWLMTMAQQIPGQPGAHYVTHYGSVFPKAGATRLDMFNWARQRIVDEDPRMADGNVIAFDFGPNTI